MRTKFRLILVLALLAAMLATATSPAFAASSPVFLGRAFINGKGLVLYFSVGPDFDLSQANGSVTVDGVTYPLDCHFNDDGILACVADGVKKKDIGMTASIVLGGSDFETIVPEPNIPAPVCGEYTYNVYDWGPDEIPWGTIGTYDQFCSPASVGDTINYYNPNWNNTYTYYYSLDGSEVCAPDLGNGYYYDCYY